MTRFPPKAKPDVRIQWTSYLRRPLSWSIVPEPVGPAQVWDYDGASRPAVYEIEVGEKVVFSAVTDFEDTGCIPVAWEWSFGDGRKAFGEQVVHAYTSPAPTGIQAVLTVSDNKGRRYRARQAMYIEEFSVKPVLLSRDNLLVSEPTP